MGAVRNLIVKLSADVAELQKGLDKGVAETKKFRRQVDGNLSSLNKSFSSLTSGIRLATAALATFGAASFVRNQVELADKVGDASARLGIQVETLSRLGDAAKLSDSSLDEVINAMQFLARKGLDAQASLGGVKKSLGSIATGKLDEQFLSILESISKIPNEAKRIEVISEVFGRSSESIVNLAANFDTFKKDFTSSTASVSTQSAQLADKLEKDYARVTTSITRGFQSAVISVVEFLDKLEKSPPIFARAAAEATKTRRELEQGLTDPDAISIPGGGLHGAITREQPKIEKAAATAGKSALDQFLESLGNDTKIDKTLGDISKKIREGMAKNAADLTSARGTLADINDQLASPLAEMINQRDRTIAALNDVAFQHHELEGDVERLISEVTADTAKQIADLGKPVEKATKQVSEFALEAARNMQDVFADFLFDPFSDGLKGMVEGFGNALRRMVAEATAARLFEAIGGAAGAGGIAGFLGQLFGLGATTGGSVGASLDARASGGPVNAGQAYKVGEHGTEFFVPGASGSIVPHAGGGMNFAPVYNIDARGATTDLIAALPKILREHAKQVEFSVFKRMRDRRAPV